MGYRYIGSKEKLANDIINIMLENVPSAKSVIDLMAGTGNMSLALRKRGFTVIASDMMTYSYHHLIVNLCLKEPPFFNSLVGTIKSLEFNSTNNYPLVLSFLNNQKGVKGYFYKEFSPEGNPTSASKPRMYYTSENAQKIDALREIILSWHQKKLISDVEHSLLIHNLIMDSNDIANIAGTYGHYLSHFVQRSTMPLVLRPWEFDTTPNITSHQIRKGHAEILAPNLEGDICYIDPPYIKRQYAANYHILETLARGDCPPAIGKSGLRPWRDQYSNFCSKIKIRDSFTKIITGVRTKHFFISYSEDGLLTLQQITEFLQEFGFVHVHTIEYKRFKSNNSSKTRNIKEYLIHLQR